MAALSGAASADSAPLGLEEVIIGAFAHDVGPFGNDKEEGTAVNGELVFASPGFLRYLGSPKPHFGGTYAFDDDSTSQVYAGLTWRFDFRRVFVYGSLGGAVHNQDPLNEEDQTDLQNKDQKALGCRILFREAVGVGYQITERLSIAGHLGHISNSNVCDSNEGLDSSGIRIGWRL